MFARQSCLVMERDQLFARQSSLASPLSWGDCALGRENSNNSLSLWNEGVCVYIYLDLFWTAFIHSFKKIEKKRDLFGGQHNV